MLGVSRTTVNRDKINRERIMNTLSEDNEPLLADVANAHPDGRICRLKNGDFCDDLGEEDDADQKSLTLDCLKEKSKTSRESIRDRDFVSESSLSIVSDADLFHDNSPWWSMMNNSNSNIDIQTLSSSINTNTLTLTNLNSSMNNINYHNINNSTSNVNSITHTTINNNSVSNNNSISTSTHASNHFYNARSPTRRRSSLLSDITIGSDDQVSDDIDAHTTDSNDSSWANNSALLVETVSRFSPIYSPGGNETIEEEHFEYKEQLKQDRETCKASSATTAAPVIPRRRVSATRVSATYKGSKRAVANINHNHRATAAVTAANDFVSAKSTMTRYSNVAAIRAMARGNAAAPTIPQRTPSHHSKLPPINKNAMIYQMYNASFESIPDSQTSYETEPSEPSFFEDRSAAAAAAAAYLSSASIASQQEEVRTVQTAITSSSTDTPVLTNQCDESKLSRKEYLVDSTMPLIIPERRESVPMAFATIPSFDEDEDEDEEIPSIVDEELTHDSDLAIHPTTTKTSNQPPTIPLRTRSGSEKKYADSPRSSGNRKLKLVDTQPPTCPMRKVSNHHTRWNHSLAAILSPRHAKVVLQGDLLSQHQPQGHPSLKHKPPTKPTRTNSKSISRSPTSATSSS